MSGFSPQKYNHDLYAISKARWARLALFVVENSYKLNDIAKLIRRGEKLNNHSKKIYNSDYTKRADYLARSKVILKSLMDETQKKYIKKFGVSFEQIITKAKAGDFRALFKLIKFDKAWLFSDWVKLLILEQEWEDNAKFFSGLGDVIRHKQRSRNRSKSVIERKIYSQIDKFALLRHYYSLSERKEIYHMCYEFISKSVLDDDILNLGTFAKLDFIEVGSNGETILSELIKNGILEDISSTEVRLKGNLNQNMGRIREIAKGNFEKIWGILQQPHLSSKDIPILDRIYILHDENYFVKYLMRQTSQ